MRGGGLVEKYYVMRLTIQRRRRWLYQKAVRCLVIRRGNLPKEVGYKIYLKHLYDPCIYSLLRLSMILGISSLSYHYKHKALFSNRGSLLLCGLGGVLF